MATVALLKTKTEQTYFSKIPIDITDMISDYVEAIHLDKICAIDPRLTTRLDQYVDRHYKPVPSIKISDPMLIYSGNWIDAFSLGFSTRDHDPTLRDTRVDLMHKLVWAITRQSLYLATRLRDRLSSTRSPKELQDLKRQEELKRPEELQEQQQPDLLSTCLQSILHYAILRGFVGYVEKHITDGLLSLINLTYLY